MARKKMEKLVSLCLVIAAIVHFAESDIRPEQDLPDDFDDQPDEENVLRENEQDISERDGEDEQDPAELAVKAIVDKKIVKNRSGRRQTLYLVQWEDEDIEPSWEPLRNLHCDLYVNQPGYILYKQAQKTSQYNIFEVTFKTIDATGMLLYAQSVEKGDFLTIELVRGKIRYGAEFGNGAINNPKQVKGFHQLYVGQDLADNQWHTVKVTQNTQDITIIIDGKREPKFFGFRRAPPAPTAFSVEEVYVGGMYSYLGVSEQRSVAQEGTSMCIRAASMNGINLLDNSASTRINIATFCQALKYYPIFFPNKVSHLAYKNYAEKSLKLKFDFRTVIPEQIVANYSNTLTKSMDLIINREGRLVLGVTVENSGSYLLMKTGKPKLNDGKWHTVEFFISNRAPNYEAEFTVDGVKRRSKYMNPFVFNGGPLHLGFGFTGCMKNFFLNDKALDYTKLQKVSVLMGKCSLKDFCTPNPCNGGKCNQTDTIVRCDCRAIPYKGSTCSQSRFNYTCTEIHQKAGARFRSDKYWLDMDGIGPFAPTRAFCRKGRTPQDTITQINTTIQYDIDVINPTGRKSIPVTYLGNEGSIRQIRLHFKSCRQFIRYRCARSALFNSPEGPKMAQWMGFDDKLHFYWGGSGGKRGYCACGITRTCNNPLKHCNCDSLRFIRNMEDRGYLSIKNHLPVRRIDYFDVESESGKVGISSLGAFECWNVNTDDLAATFREPFSYMQIGVDWRNDWNNNIDASDVALEFLTTSASGVIVFARGTISGDFLQIRLMGRTRARATMNLGYYKNMHLDVDIASLNRTFDDNQPHQLRLDFNRREMNLTVDNITRIVEFHYQYGITHLDLDGSPFYVGGRSDGLEDGFVGIVRRFYYGGKLVNLPREAQGLSKIGVYPGQGSACVLVKSPCNQGFCIEEYNQFKCNCSVSAFTGPNCQLDENALVFQTGNYIEYNFQNPVLVQEAYINVAFKTKSPNSLIFQLRGSANAHITLVIIGGSLKLLFNFKELETDVQSITFRHPTLMGTFNDDKRHVIRVHHKENQIFTFVLDDNNKPIQQTTNISAPFITSYFPKPQRLSLGRRGSLLVGNPTTFGGCVTGLRYQYLPKDAKMGVNIDLVKLFTVKNTNLVYSSPPPVNGSCGSPLPTPPPLPPIIAPQQFNFRNPVITVAPIGTQFTFAKIVIVIIIIILAIIVIILFFVTINCVEKYKKKYRLKEKRYREEKLMLTENGEGPSTTESAPLKREYYRDVQPEPEIPMQDLKPKPQQDPYAYNREPEVQTAQPSYGAGSVSYAPNAPVSKPSYEAAPSSPDDKEDGDWFL